MMSRSNGRGPFRRPWRSLPRRDSIDLRRDRRADGERVVVAWLRGRERNREDSLGLGKIRVSRLLSVWIRASGHLLMYVLTHRCM